jgi:hypothetical protein
MRFPDSATLRRGLPSGTRCPFSERAEDGVIEHGYADVVKLAGHSCPTVASAYVAPFTGLKPAGLDLGLPYRLRRRALNTGSADAVVKL